MMRAPGKRRIAQGCPHSCAPAAESKGMTRLGGVAPGGDRYAALDGVRAIAALLVFFYHADWLPGGYLGVDLFFVLSGFLITDLLVVQFGKTGHIDLRRFWFRRVFRLAPALTAYLAMGILLAWKTKPDSLYPLLMNAVGALCGVFNWFSSLGLSEATAWDGHLWSLSVEAQFYLLWPLALAMLLRQRLRVHAIGIGLAAMTLIAGWRVVVWAGAGAGVSFDHWYRGTDCRADGLIAGAMLAVALRDGALRVHTPARRHLVALLGGAGWALVVVFVLLSPTLEQDPVWLVLGGFTAMAVAAAAIMTAAVMLPSSAVSRFLTLRPLIHVGGISYAFYLWHFPVIFGLMAALGSHLPRPVIVLVALIVALTMAQLSMWLIERPAGRLRGRLESKWTTPDGRRAVRGRT